MKKQHPHKQQPRSKQSKPSLQSQQFLKNGKTLDWDKLLIPLSLVIALVLIISSIAVGYYVSIGKSNAVTKNNLKISIQEALQKANNSLSSSQQSPQPEEFAKVISEIASAPILGDKNAKVAIVEFSDYECPFCKQHFQEVHGKIKSDYIDSGKVFLAYRNYPLDFHDPLATQEALAGLCIKDLGNDQKYFEYHDLLFTNTTSNGKGLEKSKLYDFAAQVGIDRDKFTQCLDSEKFKDIVKADIDAGTKIGISGTPGFIVGKVINGKVEGKLIAGAYPYGTFKQVIEEMLKS